ncbi:MAG: alpha/beta hydrolase, partial [Pirellulales bacterium]
IAKYHGPLLQIHGDADRIVPLELGRRVVEAANEPKQLVIVAGGDHNDPRSGAAYRAIERFLSELPAQ